MMTPFRKRWMQWNKWSVRSRRAFKQSRLFVSWQSLRGVPWKGKLKPLGREYGPREGIARQ
jgi:hypothetical protein